MKKIKWGIDGLPTHPYLNKSWELRKKMGWEQSFAKGS